MHTRSRHGFTLIELIIAIAILGVISIALFQVYAHVIRTNRQLEMTAVLQENVKNITDTLSKELRNSHIDEAATSETILSLTNGASYYSMSTNITGITVPCAADACFFGRESAGAFTQLTSDAVHIHSLKFFVTPTEKDPLIGTLTPQALTIVADVQIAHGFGLRPDEAARTRMVIQTVLTEKIYKK